MGWKSDLNGGRREDAGPDRRATSGPDAPGSEPLAFTEGQRRHLEIAFRSLLAGAQETRAKLRSLASIASETPGWVQAVAAEIDQVIVQTRRAATTLELSLDSRETPLQRELAAWASTSWSMILGCRPSALHSFGSVDSRLAEALGPVVDGMATRLLHIRHLAEAATDADPDSG